MSNGDRQLEDTIYLPFTTAVNGVPTVLAGTPAIDIYEDITATPIITGESLTVDLNSVVGFNMITVTATAGTGFEAGKTYTAIIETGTVGGKSVVGTVVAEFTLDASAAAMDLANGTDGLGALKALIDTLDNFVDTEVAAIKTVTDKFAFTVANQVDSNVLSISGDGPAADNAELFFDNTGFTASNSTIGTTTTNTDMRGTDSAATAAALATAQTDLDTITDADGVVLGAAGVDLIWDEAQAGHVAAGSFGVTASEIAALQTDLDNATDGLGALKTLIDAVQADLDNGTDGLGALKALIDTLDNFVDTEVAAIKTVTDKFAFTKANQVDANTLSINGATVVGDGNAVPWDGA